MLPVGSAVVTLDLTLTYIRPIDPRNTPVTATGRVLNVGCRTVCVSGEVVDRRGAMTVHAGGNFSILSLRPPASA
ncbi:PaaI family thioesterase [Sphingomonas sp. SAFR-052]|uniref:PaaI family thioesterase n=1 Tax=Sphingomonas sp. SAFR-052 TaxID=3436867 RepID=UPI003F824037